MIDPASLKSAPAWAVKARAVSRWMLYAAGILMILAFVATFGASSRTPRLIEFILIGAGLGGVALGLFALLIRFVVLAFGYHRFSIKAMMLLVLCLGTGGAFLANRMLIGIAFLLLAAIVVISVLWSKDNQADMNSE